MSRPATSTAPPTPSAARQPAPSPDPSTSTAIHTTRTARDRGRPRRSGRRHGARPVLAGAAATVLATGSMLLGGGSLAFAQSVTGPEGQTVSVTPATDLDPAGTTITVSGSGFDLSKGIYVALCVDNGPGQLPTPCLGGVDMSGSSGSSAWISSNPPSYGEGLAVPFEETGGTGSFEVSLTATAADDLTDCLDPAQAPNGCVVGTRTDHTRTADRSADAFVPLTWSTGGTADDQATDDTGGSATDTADDTDTTGADAGTGTGTGSDAGTTTTGTTGGTGGTTTGEATAGSDDGDLAMTGSSVTLAAALGLGLLGAGSALTLRARARRSAGATS